MLTDISKLNEHIKDNHTDEICAKWIKTFELKYLEPLYKTSTRIPKQKAKNKKDELKQKMIDTFEIGSPMDLPNPPDLSTVDKCVEAIKNFETHKLKHMKLAMKYLYWIGYLVKALKTAAPKDCNVGFFLHQNGIKYSDSYCRQLVLVHALIDQHQNLLKCSLAIGEVIRHRKLIEEICEELGW